MQAIIRGGYFGIGSDASGYSDLCGFKNTGANMLYKGVWSVFRVVFEVLSIYISADVQSR